MFSGFIRPFPVPYCHSLAIIIGWLPADQPTDQYCFVRHGPGGGDNNNRSTATELVLRQSDKVIIRLRPFYHPAHALSIGRRKEALGDSDRKGAK